MQVQRLALGDVSLPDWHPRVNEGRCPVFGYAIRHPDGVILFDTGVGAGNTFIDEVYRPNVISLLTALEQAGIDERDVVAVVNSHLHFDHCGQNEALHRRRVPIYAHAAEIELAQAFGYTVPEWASIPNDLVRVIRGDERIADGVRIIETPGHTPGHVSVVIETADRPVVIAGQCAYNTNEVVEQRVAPDNMHDENFVDAGQQSLERVLSLGPRQVVVAHDARTWSADEPAPELPE